MEAYKALQAYFEETDSQALCEPHGEDLDGLTECITDYNNFCVDCSVPQSTVLCDSNSKLFQGHQNHQMAKKRAFREGDKGGEKSAWETKNKNKGG